MVVVAVSSRSLVFKVSGPHQEHLFSCLKVYMWIFICCFYNILVPNLANNSSEISKSPHLQSPVHFIIRFFFFPNSRPYSHETLLTSESQLNRKCTFGFAVLIMTGPSIILFGSGSKYKGHCLPLNSGEKHFSIFGPHGQLWSFSTQSSIYPFLPSWFFCTRLSHRKQPQGKILQYLCRVNADL